MDAVHVSTLSPFSNTRARCASCGARGARVHYDPALAERDCGRVVGGAHFHRLCACGEEWVERTSEGPRRRNLRPECP